MRTVNLLSLPPIPPRKFQGLEGGVAVCLYVAGATHLRDFLRPLGVTAFKLGLTARREYEERLLDLRKRRYAALVVDLDHRDVVLVDHPRGHEWFFSELPDPAHDVLSASLLKLLPSAEFLQGVIAFRTPAVINLTGFEQRFQLLMQARNLNTYLSSADGKSRLGDVRLPARTRLCTDYDLVGETRRSVASELFCIRPRRELAAILTALVMAFEAEVAATSVQAAGPH